LGIRRASGVSRGDAGWAVDTNVRDHPAKRRPLLFGQLSLLTLSLEIGECGSHRRKLLRQYGGFGDPVPILGPGAHQLELVASPGPAHFVSGSAREIEGCS